MKPYHGEFGQSANSVVCSMRLIWFVASLCLVLGVGRARAQMSEAEHLSHHPGMAAAEASPAAGTAMPGAPPAAGMGGMEGKGPPAGAGGMMGGMGEMMKSMGKPPPKELYPTLMALPELTPQVRGEIDQQAAERMNAGSTLLGQALNTLGQAAAAGDYAAMQEPMLRLREGIGQLESGIAARRALAEGRAPREVALAWFKSEMNLVSPVMAERPSSGVLGLSLFHLFAMALLIAFAFAMLALYFFKMRRAAALFGRLNPDKGASPPGSSPPLGATRPPGGASPPPGGPPAPPKPGADAPAPPSDPPPSDPPNAPPESLAVKPAATAPLPRAPPAPTSLPSAPAPVSAKWAGLLRVASIVRETPLVQTFSLRSPDGGLLPFTYVPGQFLNVAFGIGGARMNRSYSISSSPNERDHVDLTIKREPRGAFSRHVADLVNVGDEIEAGGPVGKFTFNGTEASSIVLLSGGVGITPMVSISRYLTEKSWPGDIFFIYACRTEADFILQKVIADLERRNPKLHVVVTMSNPGPDWKGPRGRLTKELLVHSVPDLASRRVHLCGPVPMMDAAKALLVEIGVPPDNVKTEAFGAVKPAPAAPGTSAKSTSVATGPLVTFSKNNKSAKIHVDLKNGDSPPKQSILELSEELGIGIEFSCRVGTCGVCKVKMTSGEVDQEVQDALDDDDKKSGIILACQAKPNTAVTVEA